MSLATRPRTAVANRLLAALPKREYQRLLPELEKITLPFGQILHEPGDRIRHVYFPNDSIISLLASVAEHSTLEVGIVGSEGMAAGVGRGRRGPPPLRRRRAGPRRPRRRSPVARKAPGRSTMGPGQAR